MQYRNEVVKDSQWLNEQSMNEWRNIHMVDPGDCYNIKSLDVPQSLRASSLNKNAAIGI